MARDRDPRLSLKNLLRTERSALAFARALGELWRLSMDNKQFFDIFAVDFLHIWVLGVVCMVAQLPPPF